MSLQNLDRAKLKLILQTSQGFPGQSPPAKAKIAPNGTLRSGRTGHPISQHVQGAESAPYKTKFRSLDAMSEALDRLLRTSEGQRALANLRAGQRQILEQSIAPAMDVEASVDFVPPLRVTFSTLDMAKARITNTVVVAVL
ncbi:MAG TPA: hypothetical protein VG963_10360, partial [Polyangiaceae bacterium]|nr:hypothetical protein [Polyangiaceae bacterium]